MTVARNRKAYYQYNILEELEAGIKLKGLEVKSLRQHRADIKHSFARIEGGEVFLINTHIPLYDKSTDKSYDPKRRRKLLLKKSEIKKLARKTEKKGVTLVPMEIYFKKGWAKVRLALAEGKTKKDKRETLKKKTMNREMDREIKKYI
ncbi:MAG: SsrA-binding protein SmpB [Elusimicrobiota bacterium]